MYKKVDNVNQPYVMNLSVLIDALKVCTHCKMGPLEMSNICKDVRAEGMCPVLSIKCAHCSIVNVIRPSEFHRTGKRGPPTYDINSRAGLGALHSGIGHTHYAGFLGALGLPALNESSYKKREREAGCAIESVAKRSCHWYGDEEKLQSHEEGQNTDGLIKIAVSYDMGWRKRCRSQDSSSGMGSAVGLKTGKVVSFTTRNTMCRICEKAEQENRQPSSHDCRRNHEGSSKSMEANAAVQLFSEAPKRGVIFSTYVGDDDSTTESRLKALVNYDIEKWSDINHACRTLSSRLYSAKKKVKGLTPTVIGYIQKCFTYCIKQNKGKPFALLESLSVIVPHAFGDHSKCKEWCNYSRDPENYRHTDLPGGKDLKGDDLKACIEDALQPFLTERAAEKMAPVGSSQRNECVNSIVGSKSPKIRHYGGSASSDFRTAAGVAQFNNGYGYVIDANEEMGLATTFPTVKYVDRMDHKREKDRQQKSGKAYKKARRQLKKNKTRKTSAQELHEGESYKTGIGLIQTQEDNALITNGTLDDLRASITEEEFQNYANALGERCEIEGNEDPTNVEEREMERMSVLFDVETTGLERCSEIIQIACTTPCGTRQFSRYLLPEEKNVSEGAARVNGLSVQYRNGQKVLEKDGTTLAALKQRNGLIEFCDFIKREQSSHQIILIAHNGNTFDFKVLFNALKKHELLDDFLSLNVVLLDSLKLIAQEKKKKG